MKIDVAIIGGTGVGDVLAQMKGTSLHVPTPLGQLAGRVISHSSGEILLVSRHSAGHKVPPHKVNYKAIAFGLQKLGVKHCFSTAAVGSLRRDWPTGTMVACSDFLDLTGRHQTLFDANVVHTDFTYPFSPSGRNAVLQAGAAMGLDVKTEGTYICENGPRYETPHEIKLLTHVGDVVGMTASTEAILLHEAGIEYTCLALVTNLAAGIEDMPLSHEEVVEEMQKNSTTVVKLILNAIDLVRKTS
jgi:5'-methylthioadenosine phosphorylase